VALAGYFEGYLVGRGGETVFLGDKPPF